MLQVNYTTTLRTFQRNATTSIIMPIDTSENIPLSDVLRCTRIVKSSGTGSNSEKSGNSFGKAATPEPERITESIKPDSVTTKCTLKGIKRKIVQPVPVAEAISSRNKSPLFEVLRRTRIVKTIETSGPDRIVTSEPSDDNENTNVQEDC
ncbi:uncharacterized protein [Rhodnius prolixus]|uniref:uncharacterized protein n=1 Tax=Rhodnius prolixus TaxID=13249 RepID=UPI003D18C8F0